MHRALLSSCDLTDCYYKILKEKGFEGLGSGKNATPLSRFLGIMFMEDELKQWLLGHLSHQGVPDATRQTPDYGKFWDDGRQLKRDISLILKISDLMDTLVPVAGYLEWPLDEAKHLLYTADFREPTTLEDSDNAFWRYVNFHSKHHLLIKSRVAAYLNPVCILKANLQEKHQLQSKLKLMLPYLVREDEREEVDQQLQRYSDECSNLFGYIDGMENYHPVKLWEQYGHELPVLRKYAIKMLSQPVSCMCNQVKKHLFQLEGAADCILRLNMRMMEEFRALGDDIYKPFNLEELEKIDLDSIFAISNYDISDCYVSSLKSIRF